MLARIPDLKIIGRNSSFHFKHSSDDSRTIGAKLGVAKLLEGSVRKQGERVRIAVDLINAADAREIWSETYDRELKDIFAVQSEIATAVVEQLKLKVLGAKPKSDAAPATTNLAAYNALLQGEFFLNRFTLESERKAQGYFEEAIRIDPHYALAHAMLSRTWRSLAGSFLIEPQELAQANAHARESAQTALSLAPDRSEGHVALGLLLLTGDLNLPAAEAQLRRALALAPADPLAAQALGYLLAAQGRLAESDAMNQQAIVLDPFTLGAYLNIARNQIARGDLDAAEASLHKSLELQPDASHIYTYLATIDLLRGNAPAALHDAKLEPEGFWRDYAVTLAQQAQSDRAAADAALKDFIARQARGAPFQIAVVYALRKEPDKMFEWLDRAYDERDSGMTQLLVTPFLSDYKADPRFAILMGKLGVKLPAAQA